MLYLSRQDVSALLTHEECIQACEEALTLQGQGEAEEVPRLQYDLEGGGWLRMMLSFSKSAGLMGMRVYGGRPQRLAYLLWDAKDGTPLAMMDAMVIRDMRTGAVGAVGAKYMASPDAHRVAVLGSGNQARSGLAAHARVRKLTHATVYSPTKEHREAFAREMGELLDLEIEALDSPQEAVQGADIVITGTNASNSLSGAWFHPGLHISAIGGKSELDDEAVTRASRVVIDTKAQFPYECRDVTEQVEKGLLTWEDVDELHEVVVGDRPGREGAEEITLLKTAGTPLQDLLPAGRAYALAVEKGMGQELGDLFPPAGGWYRGPTGR